MTATASKDRRGGRRSEAPTTNLARLLRALAACAADLDEFAGDPGIAYSVAGRIERINLELAGLQARDLLSHRPAS